MRTNNETYQEVLQWASCFLQEKQSAFSKEDCDWYSRQLMMHVKHWSPSELLLKLRDSSTISKDMLKPLLERLSQFEPLQYITGVAEFYGRDFFVSPATLIPRPETEELVSRCLEFLAQQTEGEVLEIGVGSGCILHTLALEAPHYHYTGVDISTEALKIAQKNQEKFAIHNEELLQSDLYSNVDKKKFLAIVSNPPYIDEEEKVDMDPSVLHYEPEVALFANNHGLALYQQIAAQLEEYLAADGMAFFEIGFRQGEAVRSIMEKACPRRNVQVVQDLAGKDRMVIVGTRKES